MTVAELQEELNQESLVYQSEECERFGALMQIDLLRLGQIQSVEAKWKKALRTQAVLPDPGFDNTLTLEYAAWVRSAEGRLRQLEVQKEKGCCPKVTDQFEQRVEEAREILALRTRAQSARRARREILAEED